MKTPNTIKLIGGPLDGLEVPNDGYFQEGDTEAVNTRDYAGPGSAWTPESVYRVMGGALVYDAKATALRTR